MRDQLESAKLVYTEMLRCFPSGLLRNTVVVFDISNKSNDFTLSNNGPDNLKVFFCCCFFPDLFNYLWIYHHEQIHKDDCQIEK